MKYEMLQPCDECPFLKRTPMRLQRRRAFEIAGNMLNPNGGAFPCHKTLCYKGDGDGIYMEKTQHCAGALIFAERHNNSTQMMRIAERLGMYDPSRLKPAFGKVFKTVQAMAHRLTRGMWE